MGDAEKQKKSDRVKTQVGEVEEQGGGCQSRPRRRSLAYVSDRR